MPPPLPVSVLVAVLLSAGGWAAKALTPLGAVMAALVGVAILQGAGWPGAAVLATFFVLSSALGRIAGATAAEAGAKGERRDGWQVLANGGAAAVGAALAGTNVTLALWVVTGSLASAGADTWATALGSRSRARPRLLLGGRMVPTGTNGGMTWLGTVGGLLGAATISAAGAAAGDASSLLPWGIAVGFFGMVLDSLLGATLQGRFRCAACGVESECSVHRCGRRNAHIGGLSWLTNDGVNAVTTAAGAVGGWLAWHHWAA